MLENNLKSPQIFKLSWLPLSMYTAPPSFTAWNPSSRSNSIMPAGRPAFTALRRIKRTPLRSRNGPTTYHPKEKSPLQTTGKATRIQTKLTNLAVSSIQDISNLHNCGIATNPNRAAVAVEIQYPGKDEGSDGLGYVTMKISNYVQHSMNQLAAFESKPRIASPWVSFMKVLSGTHPPVLLKRINKQVGKRGVLAYLQLCGQVL